MPADRPRAWLTPNIPPDTQLCRALFFPDDMDWLAILSGALLLLTDPDNFDQFGTATPEQTAAVFDEMFDAFSFDQGVCRVVGEIILFASETPPDARWLSCDGAHLSNVDFPQLYDVIGITFGGTGPTDFALPDMRDRVPIGQGTSYTISDTGGEATHTLVTAEIPAHIHTNPPHSHILTPHTHTEGNALPNVTTIGAGAPQPTAVPSVGVTGLASDGISADSISIDSTGGDGAHNNLQPYLALAYFIVALP